MIRWLTISKFAAESGYSEKAIRRKIEDRIWAEGRIWRKAPDGRILISTEGYEEWVERGGVLQRVQPRVSKSRK